MNLSSGIIHIAVDIKLLNLIHAGMAELADALDLGSSGRPCRFDSCHPHYKTAECAKTVRFLPFLFVFDTKMILFQ